MPAAIITTDQDAVVSEVEIAAPPSRVFSALTDPAQLTQWFAGNESCQAKLWQMDARQGGSYSYASEHNAAVVNGVREFKCYGEILEFDPPRVLTYTWIGNWHLDKLRTTVVRWDLTPTATGTHVKVTHSGLTQEPAAREDYRGGWPGVINNLKRFVETGKD